MATPKQKLKALKLTPASTDGNSRGCEIESLPRACSEYADNIIRLDHTGWFTSEFQDEKYRGEVWELADDSERKESIFLAGYTEENGAYICLSCTRSALDTFDDITEAARAADSLAESNAQREREYQERWQEANGCADEIESAKSNAAIARKDWRELMMVAQTPRVRSMAQEKRAEHAGIIATIIAKRERIAKLDMQGEF